MSETEKSAMSVKTGAVDKPKNKGGRPRAKVDTSAPEFKDAVSAAVSAAIPDLTKLILAQLSTARGEAAPTSDASVPEPDRKFTRELALAISEIADQGTNRKRVAPEILAKRADARERMVQLIVEAHARGKKPRYRVVGKIYFEEQIVEPFKLDPNSKKVISSEIGWSGIPNECLRPLDEDSHAIYGAYMESIGGATVIGRDVKGKNGEVFSPDNRPVGVTPGGLVVVGAVGARRQVSNLSDSNNGTPFDSALDVIGNNDPRATEVRVLGTVAAPARQNFAGEISKSAMSSGELTR